MLRVGGDSKLIIAATADFICSWFCERCGLTVHNVFQRRLWHRVVSTKATCVEPSSGSFVLLFMAVLEA